MRSTMTTVLALMLLSGLTTAEIPQMISYQGKVTDASGNPVADGPYTMQFRIYDDATGGTLLWNSSNQTVSVSGGIFSVLLGESPQPALSLAFDADYWLLVIFNGVNQTPRQRLASMGYAYMASGLVPGTEVSGSVDSGTQAAIRATNTATTGTAYGVYGLSSSTAGRGVYGAVSSPTGFTYGVVGTTASSQGAGVFGSASASAGGTYGGRFESSSTSGIGVYGRTYATDGVTYGVRAECSSTGARGVYAWASATSGQTYGGWFECNSTSGTGVIAYSNATSGTTYGGRFQSSSSAGRGVCGYASAISGTTYGVHGYSASTSGTGVYGRASATSGTTCGVYGSSASTAGTGVRGTADTSTGVTYGGSFESASIAGTGVRGIASATSGTNYGVVGVNYSLTGTGVYGVAYSTSGFPYGVYGLIYSTAGKGVLGISNASTGTASGVYGQGNSSSGFGVYYAGNLAGSGSKSCVVRTSKGPTLMYCQESPENWFEDFGSARLVNGQARVDLDPLFLETVTVGEANPMHVFVQPQDPRCKGLAVMPGSAGFEVVELLEGASNGVFSYRVVAKRKGFEAKRLDYCKAAERDSYLYPELREKERAELEAHRARHEEERARRGNEPTPVERAHSRVKEIAEEADIWATDAPAYGELSARESRPQSSEETEGASRRRVCRP